MKAPITRWVLLAGLLLGLALWFYVGASNIPPWSDADGSEIPWMLLTLICLIALIYSFLRQRDSRGNTEGEAAHTLGAVESTVKT